MKTAPIADFILRLYVSGTTALSSRAIVNTRKLCEDHLKGRYTLEIFDIADNVQHAIVDQIIAAPTLLLFKPLPLRRFVGDMSDTRRILPSLCIRNPESDH